MQAAIHCAAHPAGHRQLATIRKRQPPALRTAKIALARLTLHGECEALVMPSWLAQKGFDAPSHPLLGSSAACCVEQFTFVLVIKLREECVEALAMTPTDCCKLHLALAVLDVLPNLAGHSPKGEARLSPFCSCLAMTSGQLNTKGFTDC